MLRRLLLDRAIVVDEWRYLEAGADAAASGDAGLVPATADGRWILPYERWVAERAAWRLPPRSTGVLLEPTHAIERIGPALSNFSLIAVRFPSPSEGRGYTQGRLLRERWGFAGELRAVDYVRHDQLFFLARCGFNAFELPEHEFPTALAALGTFTAEYQASNDSGLATPLRHR
jgi:uncharacterized protein (DUF934 family)